MTSEDKSHRDIKSWAAVKRVLGDASMIRYKIKIASKGSKRNDK